MKVGVKVTGLQSFVKKMAEADETGKVAMALGLQRQAISLHAEALRGIFRQSPGRTVTRYNPKRQHVVSKPGDPFNVDRGTVTPTIKWEVDANRLEARVGSDSKIAYWLERGTDRMAARPWLWPAVIKLKNRLPKMFKFSREDEADIG